MSNVNKSDLVKLISEKIEVPKTQAEKFLNGFFEVVVNELEQGNKISLVGIGKFEVRNRQARTARSPKDPSVVIQVPAKLRPTFTFSKAVADKINK